MTRHTIKANCFETLDWRNGTIVDWTSAGTEYKLNGQSQRIAKYNYSFNFDGSITSRDGNYVFIYQRLGTKGLLLKNGELLREINRSYYCADSYEYPAAFINFDGKTYLAHCPKDYCQLDFEDAETGEIITDIEGRKPSDIFHSRLSVSPDGNYLLAVGWVWHPVETFLLFNIAECLKNPLLLDQKPYEIDFGTEINSACFIDNDNILVAASDEEPFDDEVPPALPQKHIAVWNFKTNSLSTPVKVAGEFGNLFAINNKLAWDLFKYPKIINIETGEIVDKIEEINSGLQCSSIYTNIKKIPQIRFERESGMIAIKISSEIIEVLSPD